MNVRIALPLAAALTALVAGCSGSSDKPQTLPTLTATPAPTSSAAPVPAAAKAKTPQGADAFVRFFFDQLNVAFSSSDASIIEALQNGECVSCANYERDLRAAKADGNFLRGPTFVISDTAAAPLQKLGTTVEVFGTSPARDEVDSAGKQLRSVPEQGAFHFTVYVKTSATGWLVSAIVQGTK